MRLSRHIKTLTLLFITSLLFCCKDNSTQPIEEPAEKEVNWVFSILDSIALYEKPHPDSNVIAYVRRGMILRVFNQTVDSSWYKVKFSGVTNYLFDSDKEFWVQRRDCYEEPTPNQTTVTVDLSVYEKPRGQFTEKLETRKYLDSLKSITIDSFYVSAIYQSRYCDPVCSNPVYSTSLIYRPSHYFLFSFAWEQYRTDADSLPEYEARYDTLFNNGIITPTYELVSSRNLKDVRTRLYLGKTVMQNAACYSESYIGTEIQLLVDTTFSVSRNKLFQYHQIPSNYLFESSVGEVRDDFLLMIFEITFADATTQILARRISIGWPLCL